MSNRKGSILEKESQPTNVIQFPLKNNNNNFISSQNIEEMKQQAENNKKEFVELIVNDITDELFFKLTMLGFDVASERCVKDIFLVVESLKSLVLKTVNVEHGMQLAAEKLIGIDDEYEETPEGDS